MSPRLDTLEVLVVDVQATAAEAAGGQPLEVGWARATAELEGARSTPAVTARLVALPSGVALPPTVARLTGLRAEDVASAPPAALAWAELEREAAELARRAGLERAPVVVHFAPFEGPFLRRLHGAHGAAPAFPLELLCTHALARRLLPNVPRLGLRALAGFLGHTLGPLRRSGAHVEATAHVWARLVALLLAGGAATLDDLRRALAAPAPGPDGRRTFPLPRERRLALPEVPGVYRFLAADGTVLYVGKAASLRSRVNAHYRSRAGATSTALELLTQVHDLSFERTATPLEAALLEADEIKRHAPAYNVALGPRGRAVWFLGRAGASPGATAGARDLGPFPTRPAAEALPALLALLTRAAEAPIPKGELVRALALPPTASSPGEHDERAGLSLLRAAHAEAFDGSGRATPRRLLRLGARLRTHEPGEDEDEDAAEGEAGAGTDAPSQEPAWDAERVCRALEAALARAEGALRRGRWLRRLSEAAVAWVEPGGDPGVPRFVVLEGAAVVRRGACAAGDAPPVPPRHRERRCALDLADCDRLRVLSTELRRVLAAGGAAAVRLGAGPSLEGERLARSLRV